MSKLEELHNVCISAKDEIDNVYSLISGSKISSEFADASLSLERIISWLEDLEDNG